MAEDWLPEEEVLLLEIVECGLLKGVLWLREGTALHTWVLDSGRDRKQVGLASAPEVQPRCKDQSEPSGD